MATSAAEIEARLVVIVAADMRRRVGEAVDRFGVAYKETAPQGREGPDSGGGTHGRLNDAWRADIRERGDLAVTVNGRVDDGVAPHGKWINEPVDEIVPVNASVLRWFGYRTGRPIFARRVVPSRAHEGWWREFIDGPLTDAVRDG